MQAEAQNRCLKLYDQTRMTFHYLPFLLVLGFALGPLMEASVETCRMTYMGLEYRGTLASTSSGKTCQAWDSQSPHAHDRNNVAAFPEAKYNEANYCRNPDKWADGPWCYTTDPAKRWELCDIELCPETKCRRFKTGLEYRGTLATTSSGKTCQAWDSQSPHSHDRNNVAAFPNAKYNEANYCRNPDKWADGPWCYTTDAAKRWELCDIELCPETTCRRTKVGSEFRGTLATTTSGKTCQAWDSQSPHAHDRNNVAVFPDAKYNEANYCRNPDNWADGPWCYTTDVAKRWELCDIEFCTYDEEKEIVCADGLEYNDEIQQCYVRVHEKMIWDHAKSACRQFGSNVHLVEIHSEEKQRFVESLSVEKGTWLGGRRKVGGDPNEVLWDSSGERVDAGYTNYHERQPDHKPTGDSDCLRIFKAEKKKFQWFDISCSQTAAFICEED